MRTSAASAVDGRGERGRLAPFQGGTERGGERGGQRVGEQGGAAAAREAGVDGVVLGDVQLADDRRRARRLGDRQRHDVAVQDAAQHGSGDVAVRGGGEQLAGLDGPEPVPVEHAHDTDRRRAGLDPPAQRGAHSGADSAVGDVAAGTRVTESRVAAPGGGRSTSAGSAPDRTPGRP